MVIEMRKNKGKQNLLKECLLKYCEDILVKTVVLLSRSKKTNSSGGGVKKDSR